MTAFVTDDFTDVGTPAITSHNDSNGNTWANINISGSVPFLQSGILVPALGQNKCRCTSAAPQADYTVSADVVITGGTSDAITYICARFQSGAETMYRAGVYPADGKVYIARDNAGVQTILDNGTSFSITVSQTYNFALTVAGSGASVTLTFKIDGVTIGTPYVDTDADRITTAGYPGLYIYEGVGSNGFSVDNFAATATSAATVVPSAYRLMQF